MTLAGATGTADERPRILPLGDGAVLVLLGERIDPGLNDRVHRLAAGVRRLAAEGAGIGMPVPGYASLLVPVDPLEPGVDAATARLSELIAEMDQEPVVAPVSQRAEPPIELPTRYGGAAGPDLEDVAAQHGLSAAQVIELHASVDYRVFFLGFEPGFAYLGSVPEAIATPRLATPRIRVPPGSVGIAGRQTGVYPSASAGGWRLIGRTDTAIWDVGRDPPTLLLPGRRVRFVPIASDAA